MIFNQSGGTSLNFKVVKNPQPVNPSPNTIWVNTDQKITSWIFSATEPESTSEGMVWFETETSSTVKFNALKKNGIQVCPVSAKQYISGSWVDKTAKSYQGGEWVEWWDGELYTPGNEWESITGGWIARAWRGQDGGLIGGQIIAPTVYRYSDSMKIVYAANAHGAVEVAKDIDLSEVHEITITYKASRSNINDWLNLCVVERSANSWREHALAIISLVDSNDYKTLMLDTSAITGSYDIVLGGGQTTGGITLTVQLIITN